MKRDTSNRSKVVPSSAVIATLNSAIFGWSVSLLILGATAIGSVRIGVTLFESGMRAAGI